MNLNMFFIVYGILFMLGVYSMYRYLQGPPKHKYRIVRHNKKYKPEMIWFGFWCRIGRPIYDENYILRVTHHAYEFDSLAKAQECVEYNQNLINEAKKAKKEVVWKSEY